MAATQTLISGLGRLALEHRPGAIRDDRPLARREMTAAQVLRQHERHRGAAAAIPGPGGDPNAAALTSTRPTLTLRQRREWTLLAFPD
jgi:hypothetical protein